MVRSTKNVRAKNIKDKEKKGQVRVVVARGKRKRAIAIARIKKGKKTRLIFNGISADAIENEYLKHMLLEPLILAPKANEENLDIVVNAKGGGLMGQIQAARRAIAVGISEYLNDNELLKTYYNIDKSLVVEDTRRVEPKKYKGRKARARFQKSYR
ncbi:MAG: 30S ribosomal protein S9 [Candidatus Anstonellales archaeon]